MNCWCAMLDMPRVLASPVIDVDFPNHAGMCLCLRVCYLPVLLLPFSCYLRLFTFVECCVAFVVAGRTLVQYIFELRYLNQETDYIVSLLALLFDHGAKIEAEWEEKLRESKLRESEQEIYRLRAIERAAERKREVDSGDERPESERVKEAESKRQEKLRDSEYQEQLRSQNVSLSASLSVSSCCLRLFLGLSLVCLCVDRERLTLSSLVSSARSHKSSTAPSSDANSKIFAWPSSNVSERAA